MRLYRSADVVSDGGRSRGGATRPLKPNKKPRTGRVTTTTVGGRQTVVRQ